MVRNYFANLFNQDDTVDPSLALKGHFPVLPEKCWVEINGPFTKEDIKKAVFDMAPYKAPGPDGFHACFYQNSWNVVGDTITNLAQNFFATGTMEKHLNDTSIVLIPKVSCPENIKQFRPISLRNVAYKIITKAITNRLQKVMPKIIGPTQSSFVPGRQISDNIVIYQEVLHMMRGKKGKMGQMIIKIDLEKAYDRIAWDFIRDTLEDVGFDRVWIRNIRSCIESTTLTLNWNGEQLQPFRPSRGIRQGDSISPFIFVMCIERLSHMIRNLEDEGLWRGVRVSRNGPSLSHLFFADDMILFGEASEAQLKVMMDCINRFCASSGQRVNLSKSSIFFSKNVEDEKA